MLKLPTKSVIAFLAIGILVGAATTATVISTDIKSSNLALAQLRSRTVFFTSHFVTILPRQISTLNAFCPTGSTITGGGFETTGAHTVVNVLQSSPEGISLGWRVVIQNTVLNPSGGTATSNIVARAYAVCTTVSS
jgi:hypothetical protein